MFQFPQNIQELLFNLISIPSVNPLGTNSPEKINEKKIAQYIAFFLKKCGAKVSFQKVAVQRPNVIGVFNAHLKHPRQKIIVAPHTDTVSVEAMTIAPFTPLLKKGRIYGRGACDTKGPMAAALWALYRWSKTDTLKDVQIVFAGLMGEEVGNQGARAFVKNGCKADFALVCEPTHLQSVYAHKGSLWLTLEVEGKACHASSPQKGKNAIYTMAKAISQIEKKVIPELKKYKDTALGIPTLSIGKIMGGSAINIVPAKCTAECDVRLTPQLKEKVLIKIIKSALRDLSPRVKLSIQRSSPPLDTNPQHPLIKKLSKIGRGITVASWFCDAAIFMKAGIVSVAMGPGSIEQAHTKDEFILLKDLEKGGEAYEKFFNSI